MLKATLVLLATYFTLFSIRTSLAEDNQISYPNLREAIADVLREHPEMILEILERNAMDALTIMERAALRKEATTRHEQRAMELKRPLHPAIDPDRPIRGNPSAPVTIVEYGDFECRYCAQSAKVVEAVLAKYKDKVRFVYKHNPLSQASMPAALTFEAIAKQDVDKAWQFHDRLFEKQGLLKSGKHTLRDVQSELAVDVARLEHDLQAIRPQITKDKREAQEFGFTGTPVFVINGISLHGALSENEFSDVIDLVLADQSTAPVSQ